MPTLTRRSWLTGLVALCCTHRDLWSSAMQKRKVFVGTYTKATSQGIYAYHWLPDVGELVEIGLAAATPNPSYLALSPDRNVLYAVNEMDAAPGAQTGTVSAFSIRGTSKQGTSERGTSKKLTLLNTVPSGGTAPCNLTVDSTGRMLFVANYDSGSVATFQILADGSISSPVEDIYYPGHSINPERQQSAHTHCTTISPDHRWLLVNDLGLDRILVYRFDPRTARLTPNEPPFYSAIPGSGPRNFAFHPNTRWAYSVNEIASTVDGLHWDSERGTLTRFQNISTLPKGSARRNTAAAVVVHPSGRFAYVSNRGDDSIAVFSVDQSSGHLAPLQHISCGGKTPRYCTLAPGGKWLLVANQDSANIVILRCDTHTGKLAATGKEYALDSPVCLVFE